ncbi:hypothetical protein BGW36DRAFT_379992 [Talaromyces proteolyticus]|uniref:Uncharacterized protein n=1 Tax=Talaromyces proteolyticus TaxID=1131652 RepID=A0AAD4KTU4_9EURO|nr:uncharacterized protein BGW36DRAFT_379992 [Talaromyces proteolyticus]KAH8695969.1 hypothetical protein BGW36DRAFT_379992 [Talaromyces proteolyticus]
MAGLFTPSGISCYLVLSLTGLGIAGGFTRTLIPFRFSSRRSGARPNIIRSTLRQFSSSVSPSFMSPMVYSRGSLHSWYVGKPRAGREYIPWLTLIDSQHSSRSQIRRS